MQRPLALIGIQGTIFSEHEVFRVYDFEQPRTQALWFTTPLRGNARGDARGRNTEYPRAPRNGHAASLRQTKAPGYEAGFRDCFHFYTFNIFQKI